MNFTQILQNAGHLPAADIADEVNQALKTAPCLVITAPPGAGKSTFLPLSTLFGQKGKGKILMLEPRRIAARHIAERMSHLVGESVGQTIGYRVRFESKVSAATRIEVLTEGILTRMLINDVTLDGVDTIIFDEFHERNINADLALALARQVQQIVRNDLKIVIMSATIDATSICKKLNAPLIESKGRMFPVEVVHTVNTLSADNLNDLMVDTIRQAHKNYEGNILAFLPGQAEIITCLNRLKGSLGQTKVLPLYGNLSPKEQQQAILPTNEGERKVVLSTPIAETSVTIEGVSIVVDSGLCRKPVFDPRTGLSHLQTMCISKDMATQRTGRAGRTTEGVCFRLWPLAIEHQMEEQRQPEIIGTDLSTTLLNVAAFGESNIMSLPWLTPPPLSNVANAQHLLQLLGALNNKGHITPLGLKMAALPCHPRIARMIICASDNNMKALACDIAALLEEKDPMADDESVDITLRLLQLRSCRQQKHLEQWKRIAQIASEYRKLFHLTEDNTPPTPECIGQIIAYAYPERIAMATNAIGHYKLATGDEVCVNNSDIISSYHWIAIASLSSKKNAVGRVFLAAPLDVEDLDESFFFVHNNLSWNSKQGRIIAQQEKRIGQLVVKSIPIQSPNNDDIISLICQSAQKDGLSMFEWTEQVKQLQQRIDKVALWHPELNIPDVSSQHLLLTAQKWLPFYLMQEGKIKTTIDELKKIDLCDVIWSMLPYDTQQEINRLAPKHIKMPTGSNIKIDYRSGTEAPVLSVRLQECFGMANTPRINDGKQALLMELLSPGFKPVQLTQDLHNFWQDTYFEVRKELRRRYPKHFWPDNPSEAEAVKGVKPKNKK